ncbi:MAG: alpha-galactosidase [Mucilaginibacter sp.]|nr:alpha-galactosidase [Mucilaginibacter sp.]
MNRRHFVKLSATTTAALLFSRITDASCYYPLINTPDEVWGKLDAGWFKLKRTNGSLFTFNDIEVSLKTNNNAKGVYIQSPSLALTGIRLHWKHNVSQTTKCLGDHWERTYGDEGWKTIDASTKNPWYVLLHDNVQTACFGVKTGCNAICWWTVNTDGLELTIDTHSGGVGVQLGSRKLHAADIITTQSTATETPFITAQRFCKLMCEKPRLPKQPVYGINDWYYAYGNNSPKLIKEQTAIMAELVTDTNNRPFSVIDAGWAAYSPLLPNDGGWADDFSKPNDKFKDMHLMAGDLVKLGMRPGLWTRPLCAKYNDNRNLLAPVIKGRDGPKNPVLDPTIPENIERIKNNIAIYKQWGFEMVKHDYSTYDITGKWGFDMNESITTPGWSFNDRSKTTAEIINHLYQSIRESADDMYIIGCNTMSHLSAGLFELNRIGDDTSGKEWARTRKMGVNTMGFRMQQHNAFYAADGDCVGLTNQVPWDKNKQWMQLLAESSAPLFISAQPDALGAEQKDFIKQCFAKAAKVQPVGEPLDWLTNTLPAKWKLNNREVDFDWG